MEDDEFKSRLKKIEELKTLLNEIDEKVLKIVKDLNWDYQELLKENPHDMVTCSINSQHRVPVSKVQIHEEKCRWRSQGYLDDEKPFSDFSGNGSHVTLTPELLQSISVLLYLKFSVKVYGIQTTDKTQKRVFLKKKIMQSNDHLCFTGSDKERPVPQTSAKLDQNFSREEKLAIYDYVIANTQKPKSFSDFNFEPLEKKEEKKEMTDWEIAAAERDAKRRRASYRNKVHTNRKTHTEILKEVIDVQMEALKEELESRSNVKEEDKHKKRNHKHKKHKHKSKESDARRYSRSESSGEDEEKRRHRRKERDKHAKHKDKSHKRSPSSTGSDYYSRSRSHDKYRKWKKYEGRSHSPGSSHRHRYD